MRSTGNTISIKLFAVACLFYSHIAFADKPKNYALLIGVTKYQHAEMNKPLLAYPEIDAKSVGEFLAKHGYEVDYLLGADATKQNIDSKLASLGRKSNQEGALLLGLWGHGVEFQNSKETMFCPVDASVRLAVGENGEKMFGRDGKRLIEPDPGSLVGMSTVLDGMRICGAGNRILIADCCRSSPNRARGRAFGAHVSQTDIPDNTLALFACKPSQQAFEHDDWGHGAMTKGLLDSLPALVGQDDGYAISIVAPMTTGVRRMVRSVSNGRQNQTIHPILNGNPMLTFKKSVLPKSFANTIGAEMVLIPSGSFIRESEDFVAQLLSSGRHRVTVSQSFYMGATEVTQGQWKSLMGTESWKGWSVLKGEKYPATAVSWEDAIAFCKRLSEQEGRRYRLPTEAEWEHACRAGTDTEHWFGNKASDATRHEWCNIRISDKDYHAHAVSQKTANPFGLYDMHGNVEEWCSDWMSPFGERDVTDPQGPVSGEVRVIRGGHWGSDLFSLLNRGSDKPSERSQYIGFRVVSEIE